MAITINYLENNQFSQITGDITATLEYSIGQDNNLKIYGTYTPGDETSTTLTPSFADGHISGTTYFPPCTVSGATITQDSPYILPSGSFRFVISTLDTQEDKVKLTVDIVGATTPGTIELFVIPF